MTSAPCVHNLGACHSKPLGDFSGTNKKLDVDSATHAGQSTPGSVSSLA